MLNKIISGGQTGIDRLGLEIATKYRIDTGGTAPYRYMTEDGVDLSLKQYGLVAMPMLDNIKNSYILRTEQNVLNSDGTVYFKNEADTAGFICTRHFAKKHNKPFIVNPSKKTFVKWLNKHGICTLNIAGNRGSKTSTELRSYAAEVIVAGISHPQLQLEFSN